MERKLALVTGGLSGIGKATVIELSRRGYQVIIFDIGDDRADSVLGECRAVGIAPVYRRCDLLKPQDIHASFDFIKKNYGNLDCAFNNAGFGAKTKPFGEITEDEIERVIGINIRANMLCMIHELEMMMENGYGRIVSTASGSGLTGTPGMALYSACKHAVCGLTKSVALDYAKHNITVNAIAPGTIETEPIALRKTTAPDQYKKWCAANPCGRLGMPYEIARVVSFLFEEESSLINGTIIPVDGGFAAGK